MNKNTIKLIQDSLSGKNFDVGPVDGIFGNRTRRAYCIFKELIGVSQTATFNNNSHLKSQLLKEPTKTGTGTPLWLRLAMTYEGLREWPGQKHNPKILEWFAKVGHAWVKDDERAWCAAFVGGVLEECGIKGSGRLQARSFLKWGMELPEPAVGCIVVFWRGRRNGFQGHIGFVVGQDSEGNLMVMGGNQGNEANIRKFKRDRVLGYRWPLDFALSPYNIFGLPVINSTTKFSTKES